MTVVYISGLSTNIADDKLMTSHENSLYVVDVERRSDHLLSCIGYSTIETKEAARIGYSGFLFPHEYSGEGRGACGHILLFQ